MTHAPPATLVDATGRIDEARAYIAKTLDNVNGQSFAWQNDEVVSLLLDITNALEGRPIS